MDGVRSRLPLRGQSRNCAGFPLKPGQMPRHQLTDHYIQGAARSGQQDVVVMALRSGFSGLVEATASTAHVHSTSIRAPGPVLGQIDFERLRARRSGPKAVASQEW